jgi:AraC-like DNA-binding protein
MTPVQERHEIDRFMERNHLVSSTSAKEMAEKLSALEAPCEIRPIVPSYPYETTIAQATIRSIRIGCMRNRYEAVGRALDDSDAYGISFALSGQTRTWLPGLREEISIFGEFGRIFQRRAQTITIDGDGTFVLNLSVPRLVVHDALERHLGDSIDRTVEFHPKIRANGGAGATILRAMMLAAAELGEPQCTLTHPTVAARFEEFVAHALLTGLPHNFTDLLNAQRSAAAPRNVIRAIEFIKTHAADALTIAQIAAAAGCSTRALQLAFRAWRDTTPMRELTRVRLEYAHADLLKLGPSCTVTEIALKWGFGHPGRFAQQYARVIGQSPSQTQRFGLSGNRTPR